MDIGPTYFTCTLGEAAVLKATNSIKHTTVNELVDHQAIQSPDSPAVAFPLPSGEGQEWDSEVYSKVM